MSLEESVEFISKIVLLTLLCVFISANHIVFDSIAVLFASLPHRLPVSPCHSPPRFTITPPEDVVLRIFGIPKKFRLRSATEGQEADFTCRCSLLRTRGSLIPRLVSELNPDESVEFISKIVFLICTSCCHRRRHSKPTTERCKVQRHRRQGVTQLPSHR